MSLEILSFEHANSQLVSLRAEPSELSVRNLVRVPGFEVNHFQKF
jgi:hypothetical protein